MIFRYGYDTPYWDQWWHTDLIGKAFEGTTSFSDYWRLINEHRVFFPNFIFVALAKITHWNIRAELFVTFIMATLTYLVLTLKIVKVNKIFRTQKELWLFPLLAVFFFSFSLHAVWMWGLHLIILVAALSLAAMIVLLANQHITRLRFFGACTCAVVASLSFGTGLVGWAVGFVLILLNPGDALRKKQYLLALWACLMVATILVYFVGYKATDANQSAMDAIFHPIQSCGYVLAYIGSPLSPFNKHFAVLMGIIGIASAVYPLFFIKKLPKPDSADLVVVGLCLLGLGSAFLTTLKQWPEGLEQALSSRYIIWPTFFWIGLFIRLATSANLASKWKKAIIALLFLLGTSSSLYGAYRADERHDAFLQGRNALLEESYDERILFLYPDKSVVEQFRPVLVEHQLGIFRSETK